MLLKESYLRSYSPAQIWPAKPRLVLPLRPARLPWLTPALSTTRLSCVRTDVAIVSPTSAPPTSARFSLAPRVSPHRQHPPPRRGPGVQAPDLRPQPDALTWNLPVNQVPKWPEPGTALPGSAARGAHGARGTVARGGGWRPTEGRRHVVLCRQPPEPSLPTLHGPPFPRPTLLHDAERAPRSLGPLLNLAPNHTGVTAIVQTLNFQQTKRK